MARDRRFWDIPTIIRVQDKDNNLASSAAFGRAVGWAKIQVRALNRQLRGGAEFSKRLPYRTFHYAMPVFGVSRITIWTNPPDGTWHVRIIGGGVTLGAFIWSPRDDLLVSRGTILVQSKDDGWEANPKPEYVGGIIDWKGPIVTEDLFGNTLDEPKRDILTWHGPDSRHGPQRSRRKGVWSGGESNRFGLYVGSTVIYRNGQVFAVAPVDGEHAGTVGGNTGTPFVNIPIIEGRVLAAAFQTFQDEKYLIVITDFLDFFTGTTAISGPRTNIIFGAPGPDGLGVGKFFVWSLKISEWFGSLSNSIYDPDLPRGLTEGPGGTPNFRGSWVKIGELSPPPGFAPARWIRSRMWFFNEDGTEAVTMLPVEIPDENGVYHVVRKDTGWDFHRWAVQEATINIDITGSHRGNVTLTPGEVVDELPQQVDRSSGFFTISGASVVTFTDVNGDCAPEFRVENSTTTKEGSGDATTEYSGGPWKIAADYKGNTKVYATVSMVSGVGYQSTSSFETTAELSQAIGQISERTTDHTETRQMTSKTGFQITVGATNFQFSGVEESATVTKSWDILTLGDSIQRNVVGPNILNFAQDETRSVEEKHLHDAGWDIEHNGAFLWMDLREDIVVWSTKTSRSYEGVWSGTSASVFQSLVSIQVSQVSGSRNYENFIRVYRAGAVIDEYLIEATNDVAFRGGRFASAGPGQGFLKPHTSFESTFPDPPDDAFCNRLSPTGIQVEWDNTSTIIGLTDGLGNITNVPRTNSSESTRALIASPPTMEYFAREDIFTDLSDARMRYEHTLGIGVDGGRHLAYSIETQSERDPTSYTVDRTRFDVPDTPEYLNHIDNGNWLDVSNQVTYIRAGPDGELGTADDITDPPLVDPGAHALPLSIKVIG